MSYIVCAFQPKIAPHEKAIYSRVYGKTEIKPPDFQFGFFVVACLLLSRIHTFRILISTDYWEIFHCLKPSFFYSFHSCSFSMSPVDFLFLFVHFHLSPKCSSEMKMLHSMCLTLATAHNTQQHTIYSDWRVWPVWL